MGVHTAHWHHLANTVEKYMQWLWAFATTTVATCYYNFITVVVKDVLVYIKQSIKIPQHVSYWCRDVATSTRQHRRFNNRCEQTTTECFMLFSIVYLLQQCLQCCPTQA